MNDRFAALRVFVRVARTGSFSRAARELDISQPSASRIIASLEEDVGATLFTRTTRAVVLTDAGSEYLDRIELVLRDLDEADQVARVSGELRGSLRVATPSGIAIREVLPHLPSFMARYPKLRVDLLLEDRYQDLVRDSVDVALRFGALRDSTATSRVVGTNPRLLVASPAYLERAGTPASPEELSAHAVIVGPVGTHPQAWSFERDGKTTTVRVRPRLTASVNDGATAAAVLGLGILSTALWGCRAELDDGRLVPVLRAWRMGTGEVHAVFVAGKGAKRSARAFVDHLAAAWRR